MAAIATFCMILAAGYLLWMFQRVFTGEPSEFLAGLGHHLTDVRPVEIVTLVPLGVLIVVFGLFPGLILTLIQGTGRHGPRRARARALRSRLSPRSSDDRRSAHPCLSRTC